jgi:putative transposase
MPLIKTFEEERKRCRDMVFTNNKFCGMSNFMNRCIVGYKFRFEPSAEQSRLLAQEFGCARFVYNHCLNKKKLSYKRRKEKLTYAQLSKHIVCLKKTSRYAWLADIPSTVLTQSIIDLDKAFNNFFAKRGKYPRFKKKSNTQHIRFQLDQRNIHNTYSAGNKLKLPILGELDVNWPRIPKGTPKMVTITKTASNKYFVSFSCEEEVNFKPRTKVALLVQIDMPFIIG